MYKFRQASFERVVIGSKEPRRKRPPGCLSPTENSDDIHKAGKKVRNWQRAKPEEVPENRSGTATCSQGTKKVINSALGKVNAVEPSTSSESPKGTRGTQADNEWRIVTRKPRKQRQRPSRPAAIMIKTTSAASFAEVLKGIKTDSGLERIGDSVARVHKTEKGYLLLKMERTASEKTNLEAIRANIETYLEGKLEVTTLADPEDVTLEIWDIDEITTKEEVRNAIANDFQELLNVDEEIVTSHRPAHRGTQIASVKVRTVLARKMADVGKIRVGWVRCRIREVINTMRCYKCWKPGHRSAQCGSRDDLSNLCFRCCKAGHKVKDCKSEPQCAFCRTENGEADGNHITGRGKCPARQREVRGNCRK